MDSRTQRDLDEAAVIFGYRWENEQLVRCPATQQYRLTGGSKGLRVNGAEISKVVVDGTFNHFTIYDLDSGAKQ